MNCPLCGSPSSVWRTADMGEFIARRRKCKCGAQWATEERLVKRSLAVISDRIPPPMTTANPLMTAGVVGGVGGGLPSGSVQDLFPGSTPDPNSRSGSGSPARDPLSGAASYTAAFEQVWQMTGKRGAKHPAFKAWVKVGRPSWDAMAACWEAYLRSERPVAGFVKDLSSWLNQRGHEQEWPPAMRAAATDPPRRMGRASAEEQDARAREIFEAGRLWAEGGTGDDGR